MRYRLIILFSVISLSASAQFLNINISFKKKHLVFPSIRQVKDHSLSRVGVDPKLQMIVDVKPYILDKTRFALEAQEATIIRLVKHNMSWRIYNEASYNFSDLAGVYIKLHRLSEAKWYLLQSNNISRGENDDRHTIANLVSLALVKNEIGDAVSARADLVEAHDLANARGMKAKAEEIGKTIMLLDENKLSSSTKYADAAEASKKGL